MKKSYLGVAIISLLVVSGLCVSCSKNTQPKQSNDDPIVIASMRDTGRGNEDPYWVNLNLYVWEPLIGENDKGALEPVLATKWEMSKDAKTWYFDLRKNVKFTDGTLFNSDIVLQNFDRYKNLGVAASTFFTLDCNKTYPGLKEVKKIDDYKFSLTFDQPMPTLPYTMLNWGSPIVSPNCFDAKTGKFTKPVVGTGQFKIKEHKVEDYLMLERNEQYWGEKAKSKYMKVRMIPDHETRVAALRSGEIQGVYDNKAIQPIAAKELEKTGDFNISSTLSANIHYLQVNQQKAPFNNVKMRQAISLSIDRKALLDQVYGGYGKITTSVLSPLSPFCLDKPIVHNVEKAKKLSQEVIGNEVRQITLMAEPQYKTDTELMASWLKEIGFDVKIEIMEYAAIKEKRNTGNYDMVISFRGMDNAEPATMLKSFMYSRGKDNETYGIMYKNKTVDKLIEQLDKTYDVKEREKLYTQLQEISMKELPIIPLFGVDTTVASSKKIKGYDAKWTGVSLYDTKWEND